MISFIFSFSYSFSSIFFLRTFSFFQMNRQIPLTREMWEHRFSHFSTNEVRKGMEERNSCVAGTRMLSGRASTNTANEFRGTRIAGLQKEGIPMNALMADQGLEHWIYHAQINQPIRSTIDFHPTGPLRGNFELGSDANDFLASEYGMTLQTDPFRDPRHVMLDTIREQNHPEEAFNRQDLLNRYFLTSSSQAQSLKNEQDTPREIQLHHQKRARHTYHGDHSVQPYSNNGARAAAATGDYERADELEEAFGPDPAETTDDIFFSARNLVSHDTDSYNQVGARGTEHGDIARPRGDWAVSDHNFSAQSKNSSQGAVDGLEHKVFKDEKSKLRNAPTSNRYGHIRDLLEQSTKNGVLAAALVESRGKAETAADEQRGRLFDSMRKRADKAESTEKKTNKAYASAMASGQRALGLRKRESPEKKTKESAEEKVSNPPNPFSRPITRSSSKPRPPK
jgi:hypothetical protein